METVRIVEDNKNYVEEFKALAALDVIVSDGLFDDENVAEDTIKLIAQLFTPSTLLWFDNYIHKMVKSYIRRKRNIVINIYGAEYVPDIMPGLVFEDKVKFEETTSSDWNPNKELSRNNLLSPKLFQYLPKVKDIIIKTREGKEEDKSYPFDMYEFIEIMKDIPSWKKIVIQQKMTGKEYIDKSWISKLWRSKLKGRDALISYYSTYKFKIIFDKQVTNSSFESFIISRD